MRMRTLPCIASDPGTSYILAFAMSASLTCALHVFRFDRCDILSVVFDHQKSWEANIICINVFISSDKLTCSRQTIHWTEYFI
jgi:hypothetical protein